MDIQSILIGFGVFVVSALLIWIITLLTVQEHPFEERMEQQRQIERDLMLLEGKHSSHGVGSKKDKAKKKPGKKLKTGELSTGATQNVIQEEKLEKEGKIKHSKMVELEIEPTVFETSLEEAPAVDATKKKPVKAAAAPVGAAKPILLNKDEKSAVHKSGEAPEVIHHRIVPKDAVELKHEHEKQKGSLQTPAENAGKLDVNKGAEGKIISHAASVNAEERTNNNDMATGWGTATNGTSIKPKRQKIPKDADVLAGDAGGEVVKVSQVSVVASVVPVAGESNQKKKSKTNVTASIPASNDDGIGLGNVVNVKPSSADVIGTRKLPGQDASVAVASTGGEGTKKNQNDPIALLVKQLEDKTKEIEDEKRRSASANDMVNKLQLELGDMRQKLTALAKQNSDQLGSQHQEKVAMTGHIKQLENNAQLMRSQIESLKAQLLESHNELQRTNAEKMHIVAKSQQMTGNEKALEDARQQIKIMEDALKASAQNFNAVENARKMLETKNKQLEKEAGHLNSLLGSQRLQMQNENPEIQKAAATHIKSLTLELDQAKSVAQRLEKDLQARQEEMKMNENKLHDMNRQKCEVEGRLRLADAHVNELASDLKVKDVELQALRSQLNEARAELKMVNEKPTGAAVENVKMEAVQGEAELLACVEESGNLCSANPDFLQNGEQSAGITQREELEKLAEQLRSKSLECLQLKGEVEILSRDNAVLHECAQKCDEMKSNLLSLNKQLQEKEQERASNEARLQQKLIEFDNIETRLNQKITEFANMETRLHQLQEELDKTHAEQNRVHQLEKQLNESQVNETRLHQLEAELKKAHLQLAQITESGNQQAESAVSSNDEYLKSQLRQKDAELAEARDELKQKESDLAGSLGQLQKANAELSQQITVLQSSLDQKNVSLTNLESRLTSSDVAVSNLEAKLQQKETECKEYELRDKQSNEELSGQLSSVTDERNKLKTTVDQLQRELQSLRQAVPHSDVGEAGVKKHELEALEASREEQLQKVARLRDQLKVEKKLSENLSELLHRLFPDSHVSQDNVRQPDWLVSFEKDALHHVHKEVASSSELESLKYDLNQTKDAETKLAAQVQHYKNVLSDTELILKKLQDAVETEDLKNQHTLQKLQAAENQLIARNSEIENLHQEMRHMRKNSECPIVDTTPSVEHAECVLRRGVSPEKQRTMTELTGTATD